MGLVQILLKWDGEDPESVALAERIRRSFKNMGCWRCEMPPKDSIYKEMIIYEGEDLKKKGDGKNG